MGGWLLIVEILVIALLGFAMLIAAVALVIRLSQRWIDEYQAKQGRRHGGPSAADLYSESLRKPDRE